MSYDFTDIRSIVKADGTELSKITDSSGNVIWQKLYVWEKFNRVSSTTGYRDTKTATTLGEGNEPSSGDTYTTLSFNSSTGAYTLSGASNDIIVQGFGTYSVWECVSQLGIIGGLLDESGNYGYSAGYKYFKYGSNYYEFREPVSNANHDSYSVYKHTASPITSYSKGTLSYGYVTSTSSTAYPDNSYSGSYWYVRIA